METKAGLGSGYPDEEYVKAGAEIISGPEGQVFRAADMIVKVKEPLPAEFSRLRRGQILFTYLHLAASKPLTGGPAQIGRNGHRLRNHPGR